MFRPGDPVLLREIARGRIWSARPAIVVRDDAELVALYFPPGIAWMRACEASGKRLALPIGDWYVRELAWPFGGLRLHVPGESADVLVFHDDPPIWYVNLQTPLERTPLGFDYTDQFLDAIVPADRSSWRWEDEDELEEALAHGLLTPDRAAFLRREGQRVVDAILAHRWPYDDETAAWRPDPAWRVPTLPEGWDRL